MLSARLTRVEPCRVFTSLVLDNYCLGSRCSVEVYGRSYTWNIKAYGIDKYEALWNMALKLGEEGISPEQIVA